MTTLTAAKTPATALCVMILGFGDEQQGDGEFWKRPASSVSTIGT
jgi:hypothetical protein